jgi:drug/metabolite transporter (DMT)-like permease
MNIKIFDHLQNNPSSLGTIQVLAGAFMISFSAVFVKLAHVSPTSSAFYRVFFGGIFLILFVLISRHKLRVGWKPFGLIGLCGLFFAVDLALWHRSVLYVGPGLSTILANFQVFFLGAFGIIVLKETLTLRYLASVPLALCGLILIVGLDWSLLELNYKIGLLLGVLTALAYSSYLLTLRKLQSIYQTLSSYTAVALISLITALILALEMSAEGSSFRIPDLQSWIVLPTYGFIGQGLGVVFIAKGIARIRASRAGLILLLQPTLSFIWDILFFHRPTDVWDILGALMAIIAIYLGSARSP